MKKYLYVFILLVVALIGCTKVEETRTSGVDTIDNIIYQSSTYYVYGFSFSLAKLVSNIANPKPDFTVYVNEDILPSRLILQANNLKPSFYKLGDFVDEDSAKSAFNNLLTFSVNQWQEMADSVSVNQVWIYRTGRDTYAKIRIINTVNEIRETVPYGECTFQWVYQSDGSLTFPE